MCVRIVHKKKFVGQNKVEVVSHQILAFSLVLDKRRSGDWWTLFFFFFKYVPRHPVNKKKINVMFLISFIIGKDGQMQML